MQQPAEIKLWHYYKTLEGNIIITTKKLKSYEIMGSVALIRSFEISIYLMSVLYDLKVG